MRSSDFKYGDLVTLTDASFGNEAGPLTEGKHSLYASLFQKTGFVGEPQYATTVTVDFAGDVQHVHPWRLTKVALPWRNQPRPQSPRDVVFKRPATEIMSEKMEFDRKFDEAVKAAEAELVAPLDPNDKSVRREARRLIEKDRTEGLGALDTEDLRPLIALAQHVLVTHAGPAALAVGEYEDPFADIAQELIEIHDRKGADYGSATDPYTNVRMSEAFGLPAWVGVSVRMNDKMVRLQTAVRQYLADGEVHLKQEGLLDIANDFAVYGIILRIMIQESIASGELTDASEGNL